MITKKHQKNETVQSAKSKETPSIRRIDVSGCISSTNVI